MTKLCNACLRLYEHFLQICLFQLLQLLDFLALCGDFLVEVAEECANVLLLYFALTEIIKTLIYT